MTSMRRPARPFNGHACGYTPTDGSDRRPHRERQSLQSTSEQFHHIPHELSRRTDDAVRCFLKTDIDYLVMGDFIGSR